MSESPLNNVPTSPPPDTPMEEDEEGEDLMENIGEDYETKDALDTYESDNLDETSYAPMGPSQRRAAEKELAERDRRIGRSRRTFVPHAFYDDDDDNIPESLLQAKKKEWIH